MEILCGLVRLGKTGVLPAPWFNRPSLGLNTNTEVRIGVLRATDPNAAPPDIIVTPLNTDRLNCTASVTIDLTERPGAVFEVLGKVENRFNIGLAETVTVDQRTRHRVTLVLEPTDLYTRHRGASLKPTRAEFDRLLSRLKKRMKSIKGYKDSRALYVVDDGVKFARQHDSKVLSGEVDAGPLLNWYLSEYAKKFAKKFDFSRVVVSSNADGRFIRYIFPRKGAFEARISHMDKPTALARISSALRDLRYNILLSRLSRGSDRSLYVAICEPSQTPRANSDTENYRSKIRTEIGNKLSRVDPDSDFQLNLSRVSLGVSIATVAYPYRHGVNPEFHQIRAPGEIRSYLSKYRQPFNRSVFLSFRDDLVNDNFKGRQICNSVANGIKDVNATLLDGFEKPTRLSNGDPDDLRARLWMSSVGIFIASGRKGETFSENQMAEWGFIYGQGKPWVIVVRAGHERFVKQFLIPDKSLIVYKAVTRDEIRKLRKRIAQFVKENIA